jgi:predicted GNAT family acetyltransferase
MSSPIVTVSDNEAEHRFEVHVGDELAGSTVFRRRPGVIAFIHTETEPRFEGHGLGSKLIRQALDTARAEGQAALPFCPFVNDYIKRHAEYVELVPSERREAFGL